MISLLVAESSVVFLFQRKIWVFRNAYKASLMVGGKRSSPSAFPNSRRPATVAAFSDKNAPVGAGGGGSVR